MLKVKGKMYNITHERNIYPCIIINMKVKKDQVTICVAMAEAVSFCGLFAITLLHT